MLVVSVNRVLMTDAACFQTQFKKMTVFLVSAGKYRVAFFSSHESGRRGDFVRSPTPLNFVDPTL